MAIQVSYCLSLLNSLSNLNVVTVTFVLSLISSDKLICGISPFTTVLVPTPWKAFQEWINFIVAFSFQMNCCWGWSRDLQLNGGSLLKVKKNKVMLLALTHPKQTCSCMPSPFFQRLSLEPQCRSCSSHTGGRGQLGWG